ncbi:hypothetical protein PISL3812_08385 [Talaromyces islandicus]|uniref:Uncharacterized protein n=1 Tax=Talaromyces islandicus TaxID=28573 RepID=A0A0U1M714_TALIS|nr:hypothetical protein PISL3812_08385 [Talaromyces islandicus]
MGWTKDTDLKAKYSGPPVKIIAGPRQSVHYIYPHYLASSLSPKLKARIEGSWKQESEEIGIDWTDFGTETVERVLEYLSTRNYISLKGDGEYCYTGTGGREQITLLEYFLDRSGIKDHYRIPSNHAFGMYQAMSDAVSKGEDAGSELVCHTEIYYLEHRYEETMLGGLLVSIQVIVDLQKPLFPYLADAVHLIYEERPRFGGNFGKMAIYKIVAKNLMKVSEPELDALLQEEGEFTVDVTKIMSQMVRKENYSINRVIFKKHAWQDRLDKLRDICL